MKRNKNLGLWLTLLIVVIIFTLPIPTYSKYLLVALLLGGLLYWKRALILYIRANRKITSTNSKDWELAWPLYRKAMRSGLLPTFRVTAASMFLQRGDAQEGKQIIEEYLSSTKGRDETLDKVAKTMVSMAYWMEGDLDKALQTVEEVYQSGYRDKNLFINYTTYALEQGDLAKAEELLEESGNLENTSPGIRDNRGWIHLIKGEWVEARELYRELVERKPRFPEPYVHYAQVKLHYGLVGEAMELLESALGARYSNTSGMKMETIEKMLSLLKDPDTRRKTAVEIDKDCASVASGKLPAPLSGEFEREEALTLEGFASLPKKQEKQARKLQESERLPNTELTEEDLEYLRKHGLEEN
ncbi:MAG: tetratricopeptide repeat protein [Spirochaetia bacterium]|nr:tetratricopeptide repeat protein [Spirochaetia bacterium]